MIHVYPYTGEHENSSAYSPLMTFQTGEDERRGYDRRFHLRLNISSAIKVSLNLPHQQVINPAPPDRKRLRWPLITRLLLSMRNLFDASAWDIFGRDAWDRFARVAVV